MKSRSREVNIFNMSLLDILCGALGAFCFLMLALFPDHAKVKALQQQLDAAQQESGDADADARAKEAERRADAAEEARDKARAEQSLAFFQLSWDGPQDFDLVLEGPNGKMLAAKPDGLPKDRFAGTLKDTTRGPGKEVSWMVDVAHPKARYRIFARLSAANGTSAPFLVGGYIIARVPRGENSAMGLYDLGQSRLQREGELLELGSIVFEAEDFTVTYGPLPAQ